MCYSVKVYGLYKVCFYQIAREVLDAAARVIRPGVTTDEIDAVVHEATIAAGKFTLSKNLICFIISGILGHFYYLLLNDIYVFD